MTTDETVAKLLEDVKASLDNAYWEGVGHFTEDEVKIGPHSISFLRDGVWYAFTCAKIGG